MYTFPTDSNPFVYESKQGFFRTPEATFVRKLFGLSASAHLPNKFVHKVYFGPRGAIPIYIAPREYGLVNQRILRPHRIFVICPKCRADIPFGRFHQHWKRKDHHAE